MYFRRFLLISSVLIIAFALSLYFQTGQQMKMTSWEYEQYKLEEGRNHRLVDINALLSPYQLEEIIQERITANRLTRDKTRVMEIGGGSGLAVMELKKRFPEVEFYIINRRKTHGIYRKENIGGAALAAGIFTIKELKDIELPYLLFRDLDFGGKIPYDNQRFDVVFSHNLLHTFKYKYELLSQTLRVLKTDGVSIHTVPGSINYYLKGIKIDERETFHELKKRGFDIQSTDKFLMLKKQQYWEIPLRPHFAVPNKPEEHENKKTDMSYHLPE